ncbi:hypothetical protein QTO34_004114 [Cnephaeus nilssonii]|uniref:Uncharacterized protein n=1 Tax=Cnephaeus nilssonii TaxID=3371016 RepID=A0AA40HRX5_CNENI|nr:hypothetical protein QTO34_004114 [Eptesicus nilssonii]
MADQREGSPDPGCLWSAGGGNPGYQAHSNKDNSQHAAHSSRHHPRGHLGRERSHSVALAGSVHGHGHGQEAPLSRSEDGGDQVTSECRVDWQEALALRDLSRCVKPALETGNLLTEPIGSLESCLSAKNGALRQPSNCRHSRAYLRIRKSILYNKELIC